METIIRALAVYVFLMIIFRISGKRTLGEATTFDLVLTLIVGEAVQQALTVGDNLFTNASLLVITLLGVNILLSFVKEWSPTLERILDGTPVVILKNGRLQQDRIRKERVDEADILDEGRELQAIARMDQIEHVIVEKGGQITIIPKRQRD